MWCLQKDRPRYCWQNRICYCKISLNVKVLFFLIKVWNMKNVSIWFQQKPIPQLSMFCLIHRIHNYVQINTYWSYVVRICIFINLASNILLLASKKCFPTSQGLVGAGMNCRALSSHMTFTITQQEKGECMGRFDCILTNARGAPWNNSTLARPQLHWTFSFPTFP